MMERSVGTFQDWRAAARELLSADISPGQIVWKEYGDCQPGLFAADTGPVAPCSTNISIPRAFLTEAEFVSQHSEPGRWALLYRLAWRILHGERHLMLLEIDDDVRRFTLMRKAVGKDIHQMRAFVRFRRVEGEHGEEFIAWFRPDHHILASNAKFFVDRFGAMRWAILTPRASIFWDLKELRQGPGVPRSAAPAEDELEDLWRAYYKSIFNPARLNLTVMRSQLPVHNWVDLPEARTIYEAVREVRGRVQQMALEQPVSAADYIPANASLSTLRNAVRNCQACSLCRTATQPVFGEGPPDAQIVLVGEQPGDEEDLKGRPFVGPAGVILAEAMRDAGLDRDSVYLTNAVKAFKFIERGKRRIHQSPRSIDIATCRPWLDAELEVVKPAIIVCLGGSAGQSVLGRSVRVTQERGQLLPHPRAGGVLLTYHPSAALRVPDPAAAHEIRQALTKDLLLAKSALA